MTNARAAKSTREKAAELRAEAERQAARKRTMVAGILVAVVVVLMVAAVIGVRTLQKQASDREAAAQAPPANLFTPKGAPSGGFLVGSASAKVTVEIYEDYLCPNCKNFEAANGELLKTYVSEGKIALVHHPVSILDRLSSTEYSTRAANAMAVVINTKPSAAPAYAEALFTNQPPENSAGLPDATLLDLAVKAGADRAAIESDITGQRFKGWVTKTTDGFATAFPPGGTPTAVVNGKQVENPGPDQLKAAIEAALKG